MIRRRRRRPSSREIAFSFESFLDVVANVVGIVIRLILVAWIGGRAYKAVVPLPPPLPPPSALAEPEPLPDPSDSRIEQIAHRRQELSREEQDALERRRREEAAVKEEAERLGRQTQELAGKREELSHLRNEIASDAGAKGKAAKDVLLSVEELQKRSDKLLAELKKAEAKPKETKQLRYRTPVSAVVQTEEVSFECKNGRVTLLDTAALLDHVKRNARAVGEKLRDRWEVSDVTESVGAFRLRYVLEREKSLLDGPLGADGHYRFALTGWEAEPVQSVRGESGDQALLGSSAFRKVVDALDSEQTVVTMWVYPYSFALYRRLRDYLHGRDVVVAGRPLPEGVPITAGTRGTASRGQ